MLGLNSKITSITLTKEFHDTDKVNVLNCDFWGGRGGGVRRYLGTVYFGTQGLCAFPV